MAIKEKYIAGIAAAATAAAVFVFMYLSIHIPTNMPTDDSQKPVLTVGKTSIPIQIASDQTSRARGLSGRSELPEGTGLFFVFQENGHWGFWMKDMKFSIDILFIGENGKITTIYPSVSPDTYPTVFYPDKESRYVLEVSAGFVAAHGITTDSEVVIPQPVRELAMLKK